MNRKDEPSDENWGGSSKESQAVTVSLPAHGTLRRQAPNDRCACGSGRKYKKCCNLVNHERDRQKRLADDAERQQRWKERSTTESAERRASGTRLAAILALVGTVSK